MRLKSLFFAGILLAAPAARAQFSKGDRMIGTSVASALYNSGSSEVSFSQVRGYSSKTSSYNVRIEPSMGWFLSEKMAVGVSVNINPSGEKVSYSDQGTTFQEDKSTTFNIGVGGFLRDYFGTGSFLPFGQFGFNVGISSGTSDGFKYYNSTPDFRITYDGKLSGGFFANASVQLGLTKMVGENAGLDLYLGYNYSYNKGTYKTTSLQVDEPYTGTPTRLENDPTTKFTNHGIIIGAGFQVFLRKNKK